GEQPLLSSLPNNTPIPIPIPNSVYVPKPSSPINSQRTVNNSSMTNTSMNNSNSNYSHQPLQPLSNLQQKRYQKALKKLMIEQLKNKSIDIPSICSCGQLQRKIDSLLSENKTITYNDLMNVDCANNCIYYQKPSEYHRALTSIIQSIRNFNLDSK
ncbi:MAG: hypothetical protein MJ252_23425, partial [archaeon]|nr:hypothetical protein [archaeon]